MSKSLWTMICWRLCKRDMSYYKCRCSEINRIAEDIEGLSQLINDVYANKAHSSVINENLELARNKELELYEADYRVDVSEKIGKLNESMPELIDRAIQGITRKIEELSRNKSILEKEDKEYHDEQKRLEDEQKKLEKQELINE